DRGSRERARCDDSGLLRFGRHGPDSHPEGVRRSFHETDGRRPTPSRSPMVSGRTSMSDETIATREGGGLMRIAIYGGTFDPITRGHASVIERGARLFDRLLVVIAVNPNKQPLFSVAERAEMVREVIASWPNVECASTEGFVVHLARERRAGYLVRGVRSS